MGHHVPLKRKTVWRKLFSLAALVIAIFLEVGTKFQNFKSTKSWNLPITYEMSHILKITYILNLYSTKQVPVMGHFISDEQLRTSSIAIFLEVGTKCQHLKV